MEDAADVTPELIHNFEKCLVNNFIVLEHKQSGLFLNKYQYSKKEIYSGDQYIGLYSFYRYEEVYKRICDNNYKITSHGYIFHNEKYGYYFLRIHKHVFNFVNPKTNFLKRFEELFLGIPISFISFVIKHFKEIIKNEIISNINYE